MLLQMKAQYIGCQNSPQWKGEVHLVDLPEHLMYRAVQSNHHPGLPVSFEKYFGFHLYVRFSQ